MFTFSFGSAFAVTDAQNENVQAIKAEAARLQVNLASAGASYLNTLTWDADGYTAIGSAPSTAKISKAVYEAQMTLYVQAAQRALNETSVYLQAAASVDANDSITRTAWLAYLMTGVPTATGTTPGSGSTSVTPPTAAPTNALKGYTELVNFATVATTDDKISNDALVTAEYKAIVDAANAKFAEYTAKLGDYSTNPKAWKVVQNAAADAKYTYGDSDSTKYTLQAAAGMTANQVLDAKSFVEAVINTQKNIVNDASNKVTTLDTSAQTNLDKITAAVQTAKDIIEGHKSTGVAPGNYFIAAVPTAAELAADTTVASVKATAIAQMKADLASAQLKMKNVLNTALAAQNKLAKPNTDLVAKLQAAIDALDKQVAASEERYIALINDCDTIGEVNALYDATAGTGTLKNEVAIFAGTTDYDTATAATSFVSETDATVATANTGAEFYLKGNLVRSDAVAALKNYATLLADVKDVNGEKFYNTEELATKLEDLILDIYKDGKTIATAKHELSGDYEVELMKAQVAYIQFISGNTSVIGAGAYFGTTGPKDKYDNAIATVWNKATAKTTGQETKIYHSTGNSATVEETGKKFNLYDKAQAEALKTLVADTKAAIEKATTISEVKKIFVEAHEQYKLIETAKVLREYWKATDYDTPVGKLAIAAKKDGYPESLYKYATYLMSTVDSTKYNVDADDLYQVGAETLYEAYKTEELAGKFTEAKAAMDAALITKTDVNAKKAAVEAAIAAIGTVSLDSKDAIVAACKALQDYNDLAGNNPIVSNEYVLDAAVTAYHKLADAALTKAYNALPALAKVSLADKDAIEALRASFNENDTLNEDYGFGTTAVTNDKVKAYEAALSRARVEAAAALLYKLPANPRTAQKADVEAARAAYEALTLAEKVALRGADKLAFQNLIDAEEALGLAAIGDVQTLKLTAKSTAKKGSITIKWTAKGVAEVDGYQVWKSTKANKGFKKAFTTKKTSYKNTKDLKKGKTYYYKVRAYKVVDGKNVYSDWSNKAYRKAK